MNNSRPLRIAIIAGEHSGDILGAGLLTELRARHGNNLEIIGVGGELMQAQGMSSLVPMDDLAVMGLAEVLQHLPKLLRHRKMIVQKIMAEKPDVFIGIDAPDFNIPIAKRLTSVGIKTVHYVSPSVWAWRQGRIKGIKAAVDHMLCLLPFEKAFYDQHELPATFVGHPLADAIPLYNDQQTARNELNLDTDACYVGVLPGSRAGEIERMAPIFLNAMCLLQKEFQNVRFVVPMVSEVRLQQFQSLMQQHAPNLSVELCVGQSRKVMSAANVVLLTSGTVALEALLIKRPMVVAYRFHWLSHQIIKRLFKAPFFSLPNLLARRQLVPELAQGEVTAERLCDELKGLLMQDQTELMTSFSAIHHELKRSASKLAADVVEQLA